jgi:hypothetical protein
MEGFKLREVQWHPKTAKISQIPKEGLEYALVSDDYRQINQLVWCKDFMQDAVHGYVNKSVSRIYGFKYDPNEDPPVSMKRTRMLISNWKDKEFGDRVQKRLLPMLHEIEDKLNMSRTILEKGTKAPPRYSRAGMWILDSSIRWSKAPPMISLYTLLLRIGVTRDPNDNFDTHVAKIKDGTVEGYYSEGQQDRYQLKRAEKGIRYILKHGDRKIFHPDIKKNYPPLKYNKDYGKSITMSSFHDGAGIASFSDEYTKTLFPHWHRLGAIK